MTDPPEQDQLSDVLDAIWTRSRPTLLERQATIARAVPELERHPDDLQLRESMRSDAHKLAGLLGTLGLPSGTDLARAIERRLELVAPPPNFAELRRLAADLRAVIESKH
jgi:HPt (histidine-containing phosphotransfer) domain-containing protein